MPGVLASRPARLDRKFGKIEDFREIGSGTINDRYRTFSGKDIGDTEPKRASAVQGASTLTFC